MFEELFGVDENKNLRQVLPEILFGWNL